MEKKQIDIVNLNRRSKTAVILLVFFIVFFVLAVFSDPGCAIITSWRDDQTGKALYPFIFSLMCIAMLSWTNYFVVKEINNCFIKNDSRKINWTITILLLIYEIPTTILYQLDTYKIFDHLPHFDQLFVILFFCTLPILFTIVLWIAKTNSYNDIKNSAYCALTTCIVAIAYISIFYIISTKCWSTILIMAAIPCLADIFAYLFGCRFGRHKMCEHISPKKTWEGFIAGLTLSVALTLAIISVFYAFPLRNQQEMFISFIGWQCAPLNKKEIYLWLLDSNVWWIISFFVTTALSLISVGGDLLFSFFKRKNQIKDFSNFLPGHGGILDRFDSISLVLISYFLVSIILSMSITGFGSNSTLIHYVI